MRTIGRIIIDAITKRDEPAVQTRLAGEVREIVARFPVPGPARRVTSRSSNAAIASRDAMTFIPTVGSALGPIVVCFILAGLLALFLTPFVRNVVIRYGIVDRPEARRVNTVPVPRGGGLAICAAFLLVGRPLPARQPEPRTSWPCRSASRRSEVAALLLGGAVAAGLGAIDDLFDLRARYQLLGQVALACGAVALGISIDFIANPLGGGPIRFTTGPVAAGLTIFWIVGMINSINWIDGLDGLSTGVAFIAAVTLGIISLTTQVGGGQPLIAVLCFALAGALLGFLRWNFNPGLDLHRDERRAVRRLHPGGAGHPRDGQGGRGPAGPGRADHRHVLDHRPAHLTGTARRSARIGRTSTTGCSTSG